MLQANLQRKKLATDELMIEAVKRKASVALIQEPYVGAAKSLKGYRGVRIFQNTGDEEGTVKAAIAVYDQSLVVQQYPQLTTNNIAVVRIRTSAWEISLVSIYFEPDTPIGPYLEHLRKVRSRVGPARFLVGGDVNAKSTWWGGNVEDKRGEHLMGVLEELDLHVLNVGDTPTFDTIRGGKRYCSYVDVTACTSDLLNRITGWEVDDSLVTSDHNGIVFCIGLNKAKSMTIERTTRKYNTNKANWSQFREKLAQLNQNSNLNLETVHNITNKNEIDAIINTYNNNLDETCRLTLKKKKNTQTLTMPWWSEALAETRAEMIRRRRRIKSAAPVRREWVVMQYLEQKEKYESEIKSAQCSSWKELCTRQEREGIWEGIYRILNRTTARYEDPPLVANGKELDAKSSAELLAKTFYPEDNADEDTAEQRRTRELALTVNDAAHDDHDDPPFTEGELKLALGSFNPKKAPGADGFAPDICAHAVGGDPALFLSILNKCLECHYFPKAWKEATVVALRKPGKDSYSVPKSYRPIGLLPVLGKLYEKMLAARLKFYLLPRISTRQYGFMPQRSTEDSLYDLIKHIRAKLDEKKIVTLISLDIEGAFDSAWWPAIEVRLAEEKCPANLRRVMSSYLTERVVRVRYGGAEHRRGTQKGCVQGSITGPLLWNILLNPLLRELEADGEHVQAFADDIVLVYDGYTGRDVERRANACLERIRAWGVEQKLKFAPHKTNAMVITRKLKFDEPRLNMGGVDIVLSNEVKVLGLIIDKGLTFNTHVTNACGKALGMYRRLSRAARIGWGLHPEVIRAIYTAVVEPTILYAASAWRAAVDKLGVRKQLNVVQRGFAQKLCKSYRTVSLHSALVLAGILPLDLRVREVASLYEAKRGVSQPVLGDREVERMASALGAGHPAERMSLEFASLVDEEHYNRLVNSFQVRVFTDGSKIEGRVGAALSVWNGATEDRALKFALPGHCTVYQAELLALRKAAGYVHQHTAATFGIFSDSRAALEAVTGPSSLHPLVVETRDALALCRAQGKSVSLFWIKAHVGLEGNERADELAKSAALRLKKAPDYDLCPVSFVKRAIRQDSLDEWNRRYREGETASVTKLFFPCVVAAHRIVRKIEMKGPVAQLLTGHGGFSEYLARFKCKEDPSCACEPGVPETVPHLLVDCPRYARERLDLELAAGIGVNRGTLANLIDEHTKVFLEYALKIVNSSNNNNKSR